MFTASGNTETSPQIMPFVFLEMSKFRKVKKSYAEIPQCKK